MNKFSSKFSTSTTSQANAASSVSINDGDLPPPQTSSEKSSPEQDCEQKQTSWLHTVKGKIAKTVEEKYTEYKNEKEMRKLHQINASGGHLNSQFNIEGSFDEFLLENEEEDVEEKAENNFLTHSYSEDQIVTKKNEELRLNLPRVLACGSPLNAPNFTCNMPN